MVRKQLYIEERQERALKRRAKALGVSEADVVRQALDALLDRDRAPFMGAGQGQALREAIERASQFAATAVPGRKTARYRRAELYEERERRWTRRS